MTKDRGGRRVAPPLSDTSIITRPRLSLFSFLS